jgi:hypothetical protein
MRPDREDVRSATNQQDLLVADMAHELAAVRQPGVGDALRQVGSAGFRLILRHGVLQIDQSSHVAGD